MLRSGQSTQCQSSGVSFEMISMPRSSFCIPSSATDGVGPHRRVAACSIRGAPFQRKLASTDSPVPSPQNATLPSRRYILQLTSTLGSAALITFVGPAHARVRPMRPRYAFNCVGVVSNDPPANSHLPHSSIVSIIASEMCEHGFQGMDRYVKKKDFDPIETYVPPLLTARDQLLDDRNLLDSADNAESIRSNLRSG